MLLILLFLVCKWAVLELPGRTRLHAGSTWYRTETAYEEAGAQNSEVWEIFMSCGKSGERFKPPFPPSHWHNGPSFQLCSVLWRNRGPERLRTLPKVTQVAGGRKRIQLNAGYLLDLQSLVSLVSWCYCTKNSVSIDRAEDGPEAWLLDSVGRSTWSTLRFPRTGDTVALCPIADPRGQQ